MIKKAFKALILVYAISILVGLVRCPSVFALEKDKFQSNSLTLDGLKRTYYVYRSATAPDYRGRPLLLAFHGGGGTALGFEKISGLSRLADKEGFLLVYPQGVDNHWNDGRPELKTRADDIAFVDALIRRLSEEFKIDQRRVYATGMSNGGLFSFRLACERADKFAGIASVVANLSEALFKSCNPKRAISVLQIVSDKDPLMPFKGGKISGPLKIANLGRVISSAKTLRFWSEKNGCTHSESGKASTKPVKGDPTEIGFDLATGCNDNSLVKRLVVIGGGHTWPGGWQYAREILIGKTTKKLAANEAIWSFFLAAHKRKYQSVEPGA